MNQSWKWNLTAREFNFLGPLWVPYGSSIKESSLVFISNNPDGSRMYIGRARHAGDVIPGKVLIRDKNIRISYNKKDIHIQTLKFF